MELGICQVYCCGIASYFEHLWWCMNPSYILSLRLPDLWQWLILALTMHCMYAIWQFWLYFLSLSACVFCVCASVCGPFNTLPPNWHYLGLSLHVRPFMIPTHWGTSLYNLNIFPAWNSCAGVIFVHDLSQRRTKTSLDKWAANIAATGAFSVSLGSGGPGGLPIPFIGIGNKVDIAAKEGIRGSSCNLVDACCFHQARNFHCLRVFQAVEAL